MAITGLTPYLQLYGRADQAIERYKRALGAEIEMYQKFGDVMESCPDALRDRVMHAQIAIGDARLMLSDGSPSATPTANASPTVAVAVSVDDEATMRDAFKQLAVGGIVRQEIMEASFGLFGDLIDEFGVQWMFHCAVAE